MVYGLLCRSVGGVGDFIKYLLRPIVLYELLKFTDATDGPTQWFFFNILHKINIEMYGVTWGAERSGDHCVIGHTGGGRRPYKRLMVRINTVGRRPTPAP